MRTVALVILFILFPVFSVSVAYAAEEMLKFETSEQQELFETLTHELRCLKCQNQSLASSGAELAGDLRREIHTMVLAGQNGQEIKEFLVQRYGDFVLYRPRFTLANLPLWAGPAVFLILAYFLIRSMRRKEKRDHKELDDADLKQARSLLDD